MDIGISMDAYLKTLSSVDTIKKLKEIGFNALDFNLSDFCSGDTSPLLRSDYEKWFYELKNVADECNLYFSQVHAPFHHVIDLFENEELYDELTERCFIACKIMNIPYAVFHPMYYNSGTSSENYEKTLEFNVNRMKKLSERAELYNTSIALENIFTNMWNSEKIPVETFGWKISDINNVIELCNCRNLFACLDTGHAFCSGINPANAVLELNDNLKVLHVHDNNGKGDQHLAPYVGNINWNEFMDSLNKVGYNHAFSLEIHNYIQRMPKELIDNAANVALKIAKHLCKPFESKLIQ